MASGGRAAGKSPSSHSPPLTGTQVWGCSRAFRFWCLQGAFSLRRREPMRHPWSGRLSFCLSVRTNAYTLSHMQYAPIYTCARPGYGMGKGTQTPFSLDKLKTQHGSFLFYLRKKHSLQKERQLDRASDWVALSYPGTPHGGPVLTSSPEPTVWQHSITSSRP